MTRTLVPRRPRGTPRLRHAGLVAGAVVFALGATACGGSTGDPGAAGAPSPQASPSAPDTSARDTSVQLMTVRSDKSFDATTAALRKSVAEAGSRVLGEINQARILSRNTDLQVGGAHAFLVGKPAMGKQVFQIDRAIGTVVPPRMYVWQDRSGTTKIGYLDPAPLFTAINPGLADAGQKMTTKFARIARDAT